MVVVCVCVLGTGMMMILVCVSVCVSGGSRHTARAHGGVRSWPIDARRCGRAPVPREALRHWTPRTGFGTAATVVSSMLIRTASLPQSFASFS